MGTTSNGAANVTPSPWPTPRAMPSRTCVSVGVGEGHEHREIKIDRVREEDTLVLKGLQPRAAPDAGQKSCVIQGRYIGRIDVTKHVLHGVCEIDVDGGKTDDNAPDQVRAAMAAPEIKVEQRSVGNAEIIQQPPEVVDIAPAQGHDGHERTV